MNEVFTAVVLGTVIAGIPLVFIVGVAIHVIRNSSEWEL